MLESVKEADTERIQKVVKALGWSKKHALDPKNLQKMVSLFGIRGENAANEVREVVREYFDTQSSSFDDEPEDDSSRSEETPDFEEERSARGPNDEQLKTKTGTIGVMSCPFAEVRR